MLTSLEQQLVAALKLALPAASISGGPQAAPASGQGNVHACVWATSWTLDPLPTADAPIEPEGAQTLARITADAIPDDARSFIVPASAGLGLLEVSNASREFARGEDYLLESDENGDHVLRFFVEPASTPVALLSGVAADGYRYRRKCRAELELIVWADDAASGDTQSRLVLAELLTALNDFRGLDVDLSPLAAAPGAARRLRFIESRVLLTGQSRELESAQQVRLKSTFELRGEVEVFVALAAATEQGRIESLEISQMP